jgi:AcrR family transcriptional regulator
MARPRNEKLYQRVTAEAFHQLLQNGIAGTSYASIAEACATSRAVVQDYFARKGDMLDALSKTLNDLAMEVTLPACKKLALDGQAAKVAHLFLAGSAYFEFMQRTEGRKAYFAELLRDRDQTEALMQHVMVRTFEEIEREDIVEDPAYRNDLVMSIGGFFELFYDHLKREVYLEPTLYYGQMTRVWMRSAGFSGEEVAQVLEQCEIALENRADMADALERAFNEL